MSAYNRGTSSWVLLGDAVSRPLKAKKKKRRR